MDEIESIYGPITCHNQESTPQNVRNEDKRGENQYAQKFFFEVGGERNNCSSKIEHLSYSQTLVNYLHTKMRRNYGCSTDED